MIDQNKAKRLAEQANASLPKLLENIYDSIDVAARGGHYSITIQLAAVDLQFTTGIGSSLVKNGFYCTINHSQSSITVHW